MNVRFSVILTGSPDSLSDLALSVSSLSMTLRESTACYMSAIVDPAQMAEVNARPNGKLNVYKSINGSTPVLMVSMNQQGARIDQGGRSTAYRLSGTTSASFSPFDTVSLYKQDVVTDRLLGEGRKAWQIDPSLDIMPGDTINYYNSAVPDSYDIDIVAVEANGTQSQVIITEA